MNTIVSIIVSIYLFFVGTFSLYPAVELKQGINEDPVPYLFDQQIKGYRYLDGESELPFRLKEPETVNEGEKYPLVVFLHGSGEMGNNNQCHVMLTLLGGIKKNGTPCYIFMPQLHKNGEWYDEDVDSAITYVIEEFIMKNYPIDENRIYVTGDSRGGRGTYGQVLSHTERYAAAMPLCGYHSEIYEGSPIFETLSEVPLWIGHSKNDPIVSSSYSRLVYEGVSALGGEVKYTEYKIGGHNCWDRFYSDGEVWEWLFAQSK